jgi:hypothetical protein
VYINCNNTQKEGNKMSEKRTHFKKVFNSPYLSSSDIDGMTNLTISHVYQEPDKTKRTKELFNTAHFVEKTLPDGMKIKPMILNVTNSKMVVQFTGSKYIEDWRNVPVSIFVQEGVRIGRDITEGLRISPNQPAQRKELLTRTHKSWNAAIDSYKKNGNLDAVLARMEISEEDQQFIINSVKNA